MPDLLDTYSENRERIQPTDTNNYGTVHGGNVTKWMDEISALSAIVNVHDLIRNTRIDRVLSHIFLFSDDNRGI